MDAVEDIKGRLSIEEVAADYVELKRAGRNFKALSPWTAEKTPSLMISPDKQIWHDFSSGKGGNLFSFVMEMEGIDFKAALELLARKAGVDLSQYQRGNGQIAKKKERLREALELATKAYQQALVRSSAAQSYLADRGYSPSTIDIFRMGFAPDKGDTLTKALLNRGFTADELVSAGLSVRRRSLGDMFRGRIMIPLCDPFGSVVGFTARLVGSADQGPKYLNTPATLLYDKSRHIFGLHLAKDAIRQTGYVVAVEGNLDVVASHQAGVRQVVAIAGTALTASHLKSLSRLTADIRLCFDADAAGIRATERAIPMAGELQLSVISVPAGKDPDELIKHDPLAWQSAIATPRYALDWLLEHNLARHDISTATGKRAVSDHMLAVVRQLPDPVERDHYMKRLAEVLDTSLEALLAKAASTSAAHITPRHKKIADAPLTHAPTEHDKLQDQLLALLVAFPLTRRMLETYDGELHWSTDRAARVFDFLTTKPHHTLDAEQIPTELQDISDYVKILLFTAEERYASLDGSARIREAGDLLRKLEKTYQQHELEQTSRALKLAEERGDMQTVTELLQRVKSLTARNDRSTPLIRQE